MQPLPTLKLSGHAISQDTLGDFRAQLDTDSQAHFLNKNMLEIVNDVVDAVKTPTPPLPDLEDPAVCRKEFEAKNAKMNLWYNALIVRWLRRLEAELYEELKLDP